MDFMSTDRKPMEMVHGSKEEYENPALAQGLQSNLRQPLQLIWLDKGTNKFSNFTDNI